MPALFQFWPHRLMVRTPPFQGENPGSSPGGAAKIKRPPFGGRFILCCHRIRTGMGQSTRRVFAPHENEVFVKHGCA